MIDPLKQDCYFRVQRKGNRYLVTVGSVNRQHLFFNRDNWGSIRDITAAVSSLEDTA